MTKQEAEFLLAFPRFETSEFAAAEDRRRVQRIVWAAQDPGPMTWVNRASRQALARQVLPGVPSVPIDVAHARDLRARLVANAASIEEVPNLTMASALAMRRLRLNLFPALLKALEPYPDAGLCAFTVMNSRWFIEPEQLQATNGLALKKQFRTHLQRAGVFKQPGPLVAFLHGEFEPSTRRYGLHFHGVTTSAKASALANLSGRTGYLQTPTGASPVHRQLVTQRPDAVTYMLKGFWPQRTVRVVDGVPKRDRQYHRIAEPFGTDVLIWLDRHRLKDITVMVDCWSPRTSGSAAMRDLFLLVDRWGATKPFVGSIDNAAGP